MEAKNFIDVWLNIYLFDLLRYLIPASLFFLIFWVIAKNKLMHRFIQRTMPKSKQLWKEFVYSMSTVVIFSLIGFGIYSAEHAGLTRIYHNIGDYGFAYLIFSIVVAIVFHDFLFLLDAPFDASQKIIQAFSSCTSSIHKSIAMGSLCFSSIGSNC